MAVEQGKRTFTYDGENSGAYGVYITGLDSYNAPEREVEMIKIPGRNGDFALDKGRFENVEVTYQAGLFGEDQTSFADKISAFRNILVSRRGYCRLTDEYNPDEYRLAIYKSGLEVSPVSIQKAGEFDLTFECKPQRFLASGEVKETISSSGYIMTNPTFFDASPLIEVEGYGTISINGYEVEISDELAGDVVAESNISVRTESYSVEMPSIPMVEGDLIDVTNAVMKKSYEIETTGHYLIISDASITSWSGDTDQSPQLSHTGLTFTLTATFKPLLKFNFGTASTKRIDVSVTFEYTNGTTFTMPYSFEVRYDGNRKVQFYTYFGTTSRFKPRNITMSADAVVMHSTSTTFGLPTYIDCDLGEAYAFTRGRLDSLNRYIAFGSKLPVLSSGNNVILFDNSITSMKITPRWWKI